MNIYMIHFLARNVLKKWMLLSRLHFKFDLEHAISKVKENEDRPELND